MGRLKKPQLIKPHHSDVAFFIWWKQKRLEDYSSSLFYTSKWRFV